VAGAGILEGHLAVEVVLPGWNVQRIVAIVVVGVFGIVDRVLDINIYAADVVNDLFEPGKVDPDVIVRTDAKFLLHGFRGQGWTTTGVIVCFTVIMGSGDLVVTDGRNAHPQVAGNGQHSSGLGSGVDGHKDHRVGAGGCPLTGALIHTQYQNVDPTQLWVGHDERCGRPVVGSALWLNRGGRPDKGSDKTGRVVENGNGGRSDKVANGSIEKNADVNQGNDKGDKEDAHQQVGPGRWANSPWSCFFH